ncbi:hypothetical protein [Aneurinibacillus migulanus]|uniref:Uncharacterized protein n=1 Tax=Aneurinibacillus migulanus TaxID=47500 RepID=A0A1G8LHN2_ANEMI|nr:hypothetical protein [Aneurinibacillus migulanus]MED0893208.1 hypothetical protein [Aneurinibacillus migulanus]MED1615487.1 hypothetical protein [Aneurinibacillus migulanus]MED4727532.1 hypothetical protein [Aneurinibacillus migulanus]SDI55204.1 hypothetical protein SAMN04487909_10577 [Aneurinibacillus migulanus]GED13901.1 hypothetical protein AMI01nite_18920 [Aneurinibacillus migulanus]
MGHSFRNISYLIFAFVLVFYGLPRLPLLVDQTEAVLFSAVWLGFALLIIGANLYQIIGEREERNVASPFTLPQRERTKKRTQYDYE